MINSLKITLISLIAVLLTLPLRAQYASDAFRFSQIDQTGTARFQGIGGNQAALGGDASTISGNPAGLGFYNRSELSLSPTFRSLNTQSTYLGTTINDTKNSPALAQASLVIAGSPNRYDSRWKRTSIGVSFTRQQTFQNQFSYRGRSNSAHVDAAVEDVNQRNISSESLDEEFNPNTELASTLAGAYYQLFAINPTSAAGPPYVRYDRDSPSNQRGSFESSGAQTQWSFAYAGNYDDKLYIGASLGFNRIRYDYSSSLEDQFVNGRVFRGLRHSDNLNVSGSGVNLSLGVIYKATPDLQLGASFTSPTFMSMRESFNELVAADIIGIPQQDQNGNPIFFIPDQTTIALKPNDFDYSIQSPLRASGGISYFFGPNGFLSGTIEYVGYRGMRVSTNMLSANDNSDFRQGNRREIEDTYASAVNVRLGGEYRAGVFRARAGLAYLSDPYRVRLDNIDRTSFLFSGGVGFRSERFFADITGVYQAYKSAYTPYELNNPANFSSVAINNQAVNVILSVGTFF